MNGIITKYMEHPYSKIHKDFDEQKLILEKQIKEVSKGRTLRRKIYK